MTIFLFQELTFLLELVRIVGIELTLLFELPVVDEMLQRC